MRKFSIVEGLSRSYSIAGASGVIVHLVILLALASIIGVIVACGLYYPLNFILPFIIGHTVGFSEMALANSILVFILVLLMTEEEE